MTNAMIILNEACRLMEEGIIGTTGRTFEIEYVDGTKKTILEPEPIHTYATWKAMGYQVRRGEKNIAEITIWKMGRSINQAEPDEEGNQDGEAARGRMFLKKAFFFKASQCDKLAV